MQPDLMEETCPACKGSGEVTEHRGHSLAPGDPATEYEQRDCPNCRGRGVLTHDAAAYDQVLDAGGERFYVGARVHIDGEHPIDKALGTVTEITSADGDIDDEGRLYGIAPRVLVHFDDDTDDEYPAQMRYPDDDYRVEDLRMLPAPDTSSPDTVTA
jgi:hypothetical protein